MQIVLFPRRMAFPLLLPLSLFLALSNNALAQPAKEPSPKAAAAKHLPPNSPWLFAGFKTDSKDGVYYAISLDGYHWQLAKPPITPQTASTRGDLQ